MITTICILFILLIVSIFANINLLRKLDSLDEEFINVSSQLERLTSSLIDARDKMKSIDSKGWFANDDETGTVFNGIDNELKQLLSSWNIDKDIKE